MSPRFTANENECPRCYGMLDDCGGEYECRECNALFDEEGECVREPDGDEEE